MTSHQQPEVVGQAPKASLPMMILPIHSLARYIRTRLEVTDGVLRWEVTRTLLKVIPVRPRQIEIPLADLESLQLLDPGIRVRVVAGLACLTTPFFLFAWWVALPISIIGTWVVSVMLGPRLEVTTRSGQCHRANVCFSHQLDAELFIEAVTDLSRQEPDD